MADDQKHHWNILHQENRAELDNPTDFAKEVQAVLSHKAKILELGCGSGRDAFFFAQQGNVVVATDFSDIAISKNQKQYAFPELTFQVVI